VLLGNTRLFPVSWNLLETAAKRQALVPSPVPGVPPHGFPTKREAKPPMHESSLRSAFSSQAGSRTSPVECLRGAVGEPRFFPCDASGLPTSGDRGPAVGPRLRAHPEASDVPMQELLAAALLPRVPVPRSPGMPCCEPLPGRSPVTPSLGSDPTLRSILLLRFGPPGVLRAVRPWSSSISQSPAEMLSCAQNYTDGCSPLRTRRGRAPGGAALRHR